MLLKHTPANSIPMPSQNDAISTSLEWSPNSSLMFLILWLSGNKSLTYFASEKLTLRIVLVDWEGLHHGEGYREMQLRQCFL